MSVSRTFGRIANEKGRQKETRVLAACKPENFPKWLSDVRAATAEEDKRGIDLVAFTDIGSIFIQVKSSRTGKKRFQETHRVNIGIIIVRDGDSDDAIWRKLNGEIGRLYSEFKKKRTQSG